MKVRNKGFTITELVIVIAVIAILAAVLIPTFSNVIEKANQTAASSSCNVALSEYIAMVTLDGDPDNNDVTGVVFSSNNYYYVYDGEKLNYIGNSEKDNAKLLAVTSFDTDITPLTGFYKQPPVEEGTAVYDNKIKFTIGEQTVEVDLTDTTRTLYLYNVDIDGTTYAGFFTINNTYGGSGNVIQTVNYSYESGISQDEVKVGQVQTSSLDNLVLESIEASYLPTTAICKGDSDGDAENQVTITKDQFKVTANYSDSDGNIVNRILPTNEYELINNVIDTSQVGSHIITIKHTASDIQTTCQIEVEEKHTKDYYFYNSYGWTEVFAYSWAENIVAVKPVANDFVLAGEILGEGIHWELSSSIKMFFDEKNNEWSVTGLKIPNGVPFKLAQVNELGDGLNIKTLYKSGTGGYCDGYITVGDGISCDILTNEYNNITLTNNKSDTGFGVYNIYWRTGNILHIDLAEDQTDIKEPNYAIFSKTLTNPWDKEKGTTGNEMTPYPEKGEGWWKISLDSRSQYVLFNNGNVDATIAGGSKTKDITIYDEKPYCIDSAFYSDYTMYYFYNAYNWNEVYANASTTEPIALMSTSTTTDIGIRMTAVEGKPGWFAVPVASECNTIVFSDGTDTNKTDELTIDTQNKTDVYYNPNNATAGGDGWSSSFTSTTTYYFYNAAGWNNVYAHYWTVGGPGTNWTGIKMTAVDGQDGWFSIKIDNNFENVVFNNGNKDGVAGIDKTVDLELDPSKPYCTFENWYSEKPVMVTYYYYYNVNDGGEVYAYAWADDIKYLGTNRGLSMKALTGEGQEGWYSITVDANATYIKFNSGDLNVVDRLELNSETPYYCGESVWTEQMPVGISATLVEGAVFYYGLDFNNSNIVVTLQYANSTSKIVTGFTVDGDNKSTQTQAVTIEYKVGSIVFSTQLEVTVVKEVSAIEVVKNDKVVNVNAVLDASYFTVTAIYQGGYKEQVTDGVTVEANTSKGGTTTATVSYGGVSQAVEIEVVKTAVGIEVETTLVEVDHNSSVNKKDFTVSLVYDDETTEVLTAEQYTISGDFETIGLTTLTFEYQVGEQKFTATVDVKVSKVLTGITAQYNGGDVDVGGSLNLDKLTVTKSYSDGTTEQADSSEYDLSTYDTQAEGTVTVTVTYKGTEFTATFDITISDVETYYFYNYGDWENVYAYAWTEEIVSEQPNVGDYVLVYTIPGKDATPTVEYRVKMSYPNDNERSITGLKLPTGARLKIIEITNNGYVYYSTPEYGGAACTVENGEIKIAVEYEAVYDFYFKLDSKQLWFDVSQNSESTQNPYQITTMYTHDWPGAEMEDMGDGWWYVSIDAKAENIIFNGAIGETRYQTDNLTLNPVTPYYCINGWKDTPDISDIIVLDLTEANNWITTSPRFAVYLFNGASSDADNNGMWLDMTAIAGNSVNYYYAVDISGLDYSKFTVCRMNPESTENNWDNKWNQTTDLQISNGLYVKIPADYWNGEIGGNQSTIGV